MFFILLALQLTSTFTTNVFTTNASAALGDHIDHIEKDRARYSAKRLDAEVHPNFTVHELTNEGIQIREFSDLQGKVFAIKWKGNTHPDLAPLLGSFYPEFEQLSKKKLTPKIRTSNSVITGKNVTVEKYGHLRNAQGRAYLPKNFPAGVSLNDIQ
jgi:hypothetical protein